MRTYTLIVIAFSVAFVAPVTAVAQNMAGMENTVGFLSSGTSVEPKATSEFDAMIRRSPGDWTLMFQTNVFVVDAQQTGPRGADKFFSTNWFMPMLMKQFGRQSVTFRPMFSLEPLTVTDRRYPELFQAGETAFGKPIVDGQHPHDLFMELAARYDFRWTARVQPFLYGGPIGEPALGPPAFPHRASASENPMAVLGHHHEDSTHISNSVVTIGLVAGPIQLESSTFHGREPNENRWNIDGGKPDSFSSRVTAGVGMNLVGQFSVGRINNREALEPAVDTLRMTASVQHVLVFSSGHIASSLIWGRNKDLDPAGARISNAYTLESTLNFQQQNWTWTRIENVDRENAGRIQAYTFGYERDVGTSLSGLNTGLGVQFTTYGVPQRLKAVYDGRPWTVAMFVRLRPKGNMAEHMRLMHRH